MRVSEALKEGALLLSKKYERGRLEAEILLSYLLGVDRIKLFLMADKELKDQKRYFELINRRLNSEPIEYITNRVSFFSLDFFIDKGALIPRPESELLVAKALELIKKYNIKKVAEIGIGSGALSIAIALNSNVEIVATDISKDALRVTNINIKRYNLEDKIKLIHTNLLDNVEDEVELLISNPPYIANNFRLPPEVMYEPRSALFGGEKGDDILKEIITLTIKRDIKFLICEMGYDQRELILDFALTKGIEDIEFYKDYASLDRGFIIKRRSYENR